MKENAPKKIRFQTLRTLWVPLAIGVVTVAKSLRTDETVEEYAEYAAQFAALDTGEGEPYNVTCFQDEDYTQNLSYPVYIVWYTTGSGEDQREWMVYTVDTDDYTYLYAFGTIADEADDMQDVFYNICDQLELVN